MALKGDRYEFQTDLSWFMNTAQERGGIVFASSTTSGSGVAMDQGRAVVSAPTNPSGLVPIGVLMNDVVDKDLTRMHLNVHKDEVQKGGKVRILRKGYVVTNMIIGTPTALSVAYATMSGHFTSTVSSTGGVAATPKVGQFSSSVDEDGYAKVEVTLPYNT